MSDTPTQLATINIDEIATTMKDAGAVLAKNENLVAMAEKGAQQLLDTVEAEGMSDEIDQALNDWQIKAKKALNIINERRAPITQIMSKMAKFFTGLEAKIDPAKPESCYARIQSKRDGWATAKAKAQREKEEAILREKNIANERITLVAEIGTQIKAIYNDKLFAFKKYVTDLYNKLSLENVDHTKELINKVSVNYPLDKWNEIVPALFPRFLAKAEVDQLVLEERSRLYDECSANFRENMEAHKQEILDLFPSRVNELKSIAKAGSEEKKRLEAEAAERKKELDEKAVRDAEAQRLADQQKIEAQKQMAAAGNLFDSTAQLQEIKENTGKVKEAIKINVLNANGYAAIFMFYFEKEGCGLSVDAFGKKTMAQMVAFAEKKAFKEDIRINSNHLSYEDVFKAKVSK